MALKDYLSLTERLLNRELTNAETSALNALIKILQEELQKGRVYSADIDPTSCFYDAPCVKVSDIARKIGKECEETVGVLAPFVNGIVTSESGGKYQFLPCDFLVLRDYDGWRDTILRFFDEPWIIRESEDRWD